MIFLLIKEKELLTHISADHNNRSHEVEYASPLLHGLLHSAEDKAFNVY